MSGAIWVCFVCWFWGVLFVDCCLCLRLLHIVGCVGVVLVSVVVLLLWLGCMVVVLVVVLFG